MVRGTQHCSLLSESWLEVTQTMTGVTTGSESRLVKVSLTNCDPTATEIQVAGQGRLKLVSVTVESAAELLKSTLRLKAFEKAQ